MLDGILGLCATVVTGILSLTGSAGVGVPGLGADLASDPLAIVETIVDSPVLGSEVFVAGGLPGVAAYADVITADSRGFNYVGTGAYIPVADALPEVPVVGPIASQQIALVSATANTLGYSIGSLLFGLPINLLGALPIL